MKSIFRLYRQLHLADCNRKSTMRVKTEFYLVIISLRKKCPSSEFLWSVFFEMNKEIYRVNTLIQFERENMDQKSSEYGQLFMQRIFPCTDYRNVEAS